AVRLDSDNVSTRDLYVVGFGVQVQQRTVSLNNSVVSGIERAADDGGTSGAAESENTVRAAGQKSAPAGLIEYAALEGKQATVGCLHQVVVLIGIITEIN